MVRVHRLPRVAVHVMVGLSWRHVAHDAVFSEAATARVRRLLIRTVLHSRRRVPLHVVLNGLPGKEAISVVHHVVDVTVVTDGRDRAGGGLVVRRLQRHHH